MMAEPTSTTTGVAWALAAGTLGAFFAGIGVSAETVFWGLCGGLFGMSFAPPAGRVRSILMFPGAALAAAKIGVLASVFWFDGKPGMAGGLALLCGIILHPAITAIVQALPSIISARLGGSQQTGNQQ